MASFFSAINPVSSRSGITFAATGRSYSPTLNQQELPDLTLDLIIPFLWNQNLSIIDGIYETFTVFYGDHFDKHGMGIGRKGVLDFTIAPLAARKLMADTYLDSRKNTCAWNTLAWVIALPVKMINFAVALACTIALIPLIVVVTLLRAAWNYFFPGGPGAGPDDGGPPPPDGDGDGDDPPPPDDAAATMVRLPVPTATAALFQITHYLDNAGLRTPENIRRLFANPHNLALVYAMERMAGVNDEHGMRLLNQDTFDLLIDNLQIFANYQAINNLAQGGPLNRRELDTIVTRRIVENRPVQSFNYKQSTHAASVHESTSSSAVRLKALYGKSEPWFSNSLAHANSISSHLPKMIRGYDRALVGDKSDQDITDIIIKSINRLRKATYMDPASDIPLSQLLELSFSAAMDSNQWRDGVTEETSLACLYAALYEMDREYALDESGRDVSQKQSAQSCESGAFNKCIEALSKIHKSCEVNFITPALAGLKLPCVVRGVLKEYLSRYGDVSIEALKKDGIDSIWDKLEPEVLEIMNRDFSSIYPEQAGRVNAKLVELVSAGKDIDLTDYLDVLEKELNCESKTTRREPRVM